MNQPPDPLDVWKADQEDAMIRHAEHEAMAKGLGKTAYEAMQKSAFEFALPPQLRAPWCELSDDHQCVWVKVAQAVVRAYRGES
jgi:hypothetical protein